jgi:hypothetical protein
LKKRQKWKKGKRRKKKTRKEVRNFGICLNFFFFHALPLKRRERKMERIRKEGEIKEKKKERKERRRRE